MKFGKVLAIIWATCHLQAMVFMGISAIFLAFEVKNGPYSIQLQIALDTSIGIQLVWKEVYQ